MVTKTVDVVVDALTDALMPRSRTRYVSPQQMEKELASVKRATNTSREAYARRMKMRTTPPLSRREVELAIARAIQRIESE